MTMSAMPSPVRSPVLTNTPPLNVSNGRRVRMVRLVAPLTTSTVAVIVGPDPMT
jgi:hypothetical protein